MSQPSEDTATNRFRTWWAGLLTAMSFAIVCLLVTAIAGARLEKSDLLMADVDRAEVRVSNLDEVKSLQTAAVTEAGVVDDSSNAVKLPVEKALPVVLKTLNKTVTKSKVPVPGALVAPEASE